ncbi:DUF188 domain-containing protein [Evansella sp. AB-P1]|uniref:YaiI/YqxD family protein n=1 Tax=Evansella sp. AB-P1 TaxID=3037653 RepID=UPI00241F118F|nr:DUF188 domain-containing protein [Evansella sp. AB-P1]MDG5786560.1 DUF188 domain-containing protein [Evansella sp. AB-P1]
MGKKNSKLFVDGDACPVVNEIVLLAKKYDVPVIFVSSYAHVRKESFPSFVKHIFVDQDKEAVDLKIANEISKYDMAVTEDLGLTSLLLAKGVQVLTSRGKWITAQEIDYLLDSRYQSAKKRRSGGKTKGPKKLTDQDRLLFTEQLENFLSNLQEF